MKSSDQEIWQSIIQIDWNLAYVLRQLEHPQTLYPGRPIILSASEVTRLRLFDFSDQYLSVKVKNHELTIPAAKITSIVDSTHQQLLKNLSPNVSSPVKDYLLQQFAHYDQLTDKRNYGFYAFYFDRAGQFEAAVQFPELPVYKLALTCSCSQLYQDSNYQLTWLQLRQILNRAHVLVAGASVASAAASCLIRDGRLGAITIGDPKEPNATNFNRTTYEVFDIAHAEPKSVAFARQIHRQDPTQIIYLETTGFNADNFRSYLIPRPDRPNVNLVLEAIDSVQPKIDILTIASQQAVPLIQVADVGSKAQLSFNSPSDYQQGREIVMGLSASKLTQLLQTDFLSLAAYFVGLDNALGDEVGRFIQGHKITPFGSSTPQLGSTAHVAAGLAAEKAIRYLINCRRGEDFPYRRLIVDKKNDTYKVQHGPSLKALVLDAFLTIKHSQTAKNKL